MGGINKFGQNNHDAFAFCRMGTFFKYVRSFRRIFDPLPPLYALCLHLASSPCMYVGKVVGQSNRRSECQKPTRGHNLKISPPFDLALCTYSKARPVLSPLYAFPPTAYVLEERSQLKIYRKWFISIYSNNKKAKIEPPTNTQKTNTY